MNGWDGWGSPIGDLIGTPQWMTDFPDIGALGYAMGCQDHECNVREDLRRALQANEFEEANQFGDDAEPPPPHYLRGGYTGMLLRPRHPRRRTREIRTL